MAANVYYSVCPFGTADIKTGMPTLTISSGVATLSAAQTGNIGQGCRITYDTSKVAYISLVNSSTSFNVITATGGTPADEASAVTVDSIAHEYVSLSAFEAGFTDVNHTNNTDISTATGADMVVTACCYYDHVDSTLDTTNVTINFGTTDATGYLEIITPQGGTESINNQRHDGAWDTLAYAIDLGDVVGISIIDDNVNMTGVQIRINSAAQFKATLSIIPGGFATANNIIDACIFYDRGGNFNCNGVEFLNVSIGTATIKNSIIYRDGAGGDSRGVESSDADWTISLYNNTIFNYTTGIYESVGTINAKNNAVFGSTDDFNITNGTIDYCASDDTDGTNSVDISPGATETDDWNNAFTDYINGDFSVKDTSSVLYNAGTDLSGSGVTDDIIGTSRPQSTSYDIGAFELVVAAAGGRISRYHNLNGLGGQGQMTWNPLG